MPQSFSTIQAALAHATTSWDSDYQLYCDRIWETCHYINHSVLFRLFADGKDLPSAKHEEYYFKLSEYTAGVVALDAQILEQITHCFQSFASDEEGSFSPEHFLNTPATKQSVLDECFHCPGNNLLDYDSILAHLEEGARFYLATQAASAVGLEPITLVLAPEDYPYRASRGAYLGG